MKCGAIRGIIGGKIPFDPNIITLEELTQHTSPYLLCWVELATSDTSPTTLNMREIVLPTMRFQKKF